MNVSATNNQTRPEKPAAEDRLEIPWDVSEWVDRATLQQWIREDLDTLDWDNPELVAHLRKYPAYRPKMMLRLLTYAYATACFASEEILEGCSSDPWMRALTEEGPPQLKDIHRFRRENRGLFKWTLVQLLNRLIRCKFKVGSQRFPAGLKRYLVIQATERLDLARHMDRSALD
jgi:hypothetical protein